MSDYIDTGDRVVVTEHISEAEHARGTYADVAGQHGVVESNDGWGRCTVLLDSGQRITAWNGVDLVREATA